MTKDREDLDYDVRIVDRNIREGVVSKKDYDKYMKSLPDVEDKGEPLVFEDEIAEQEASAEDEQQASQEEETTAEAETEAEEEAE